MQSFLYASILINLFAAVVGCVAVFRLVDMAAVVCVLDSVVFGAVASTLIVSLVFLVEMLLARWQMRETLAARRHGLAMFLDARLKQRELSK